MEPLQMNRTMSQNKSYKERDILDTVNSYTIMYSLDVITSDKL